MREEITLFRLIASLFMLFVTGIEDMIRGGWLYIKNYPRLLMNTWRWIYNTPKYGPVLKTVSIILAPVIEVLGIPIIISLGFIIGAWYGFSDTLFKDRKFAAENGNRKLIEMVEKFCEEWLFKLSSYEHEPLLEGERPFDINPLTALLSLFIGLITGVMECVSIGLISFWRMPWILLNIWLDIIRGESGPFLTLGTLILSSVVIPLIIPLSFFIAAVIGLVEGCYWTYDESYSMAFLKCDERIKQWNKCTKDFYENKF